MDETLVRTFRAQCTTGAFSCTKADLLLRAGRGISSEYKSASFNFEFRRKISEENLFVGSEERKSNKFGKISVSQIYFFFFCESKKGAEACSKC